LVPPASLPSAGALEAARDAIAAWWSEAYLRPDDAVLPSRFAVEARASLPGLVLETTPCTEDVHNAMALQRMRLWQDQGVPERSWR
jgi:hypothetical protein